jgi:hypothetical protein
VTDEGFSVRAESAKKINTAAAAAKAQVHFPGGEIPYLRRILSYREQACPVCCEGKVKNVIWAFPRFFDDLPPRHVPEYKRPVMK